VSLIRKYLRKYHWHRANKAFRAGRIRVDVAPWELWIEPTNHCNLRCKMCPQSKGLAVPKGFMDMVLYERIIGQLARLRVQRINLFLGGESILHKNILGMIEIARDKRIPVRLHTNATLMNEGISKGLLATGGLEEISFSFDGEDREYYERLRVNANFDKTLGNIIRFLELKRETGNKTPRVLIQVIKERNKDGSAPEITEGFKAKFAGLPVDKFQNISFHNFGGTLRPDSDVVYEKDFKKYKPCIFPWRSMSVAWDGTVVGCCIDMEKKLVLGDLNCQSVLDVWNGEPMMEFRRAMLEKRHTDIELCRDCDQVWEG